jgi:hypothetical protein
VRIGPGVARGEPEAKISPDGAIAEVTVILAVLGREMGLEFGRVKWPFAGRP